MNFPKRHSQPPRRPGNLKVESSDMKSYTRSGRAQTPRCRNRSGSAWANRCGSMAAALALAAAVIGSQGRAATVLTDLSLLGTQNRLENNAEFTVMSGAILTAASGSVLDFFHATVALPNALTLTDASFAGPTNQFLNGATLTLLEGSAFIAATGSALDLTAADVMFPTTVVLTTGDQILSGKTLVSPIISSILAAPATNLSLTAGSGGATLTLGQGAEGVVTMTGSRLAFTPTTTNLLIGPSVGASMTTGEYNVAVGVEALSSATTSRENVAIGWRALANANGVPPAQGSHMVAIGSQALVSNTTGGDHVAVGHNSLGSNTVGVDNTAVGYLSMHANTSGSYNVALGNTALMSNTVGRHSVAVGQSSLVSARSSDNTAVGANTGFRLATGTRNVYVGFESGWENLAGSYNTGVGQNSLANAQSSNNTGLGSAAGGTVTIGSNNTFLGAGADALTNSLSNVTSVGYQALATASNQIAVGNGNVTHMRLGGGPMLWFGIGAPENAINAPVSSLFFRTDGNSGTSLYLKEYGAGNTGWTAVTTGIGGTQGNVLVNGGITHQAGTVTLSLPKELSSIRSISSDVGALVLSGSSAGGGVVRIDDTAGYGGAEMYINGGNHGFSILSMRRSAANKSAKINFYTGPTQKWDFGLDNDGTENLMIYNRSTGAYPLRLWAADNTLSLNATVDATLGGAGTLKTAGGIYAAQKIVAGTDVVAGGNIVAAGGTFTGSTAGLVLNSGLLTQPIVFRLNTTEIARFSGTNGNLLLGGTSDIPGTGGLKVFGSTDSTSATTGALQVVGGVGIGGALRVGSTAPSTSTSSGALVVSGGAAIQKKTWLGDDLVLVPTASSTATVRISGTAIADTPGIWFRDGGTPIAANASLLGTSTATIINAPAAGALDLRIGDTTHVSVSPTAATIQSVPLRMNSTSVSTSTTTGSATFAGGVGIAGRTSTGTLNVGSSTATIDLIHSITASFDFGAITGSGGVQDLSVAVAGASIGDAVNVVEAGGAFISSGLVLRGIVTAQNVVTIRATNATSASIDPVSVTLRVTVTSF